MLLLLAFALAAPVPAPAVKVVPIPPADPGVADFDKPPAGALLRLGSRQMRHPSGTVGDFAADNRTLFTGSAGLIREWDTETNTLRREIPLPGIGNVRLLRCTPDASTLLLSDLQAVHVWDRTTKKRIRTIQLPNQRIEHFALSPNGKTVAVGTREGHVRLFDLATGQDHDLDITPSPQKTQPSSITSLAWLPDGKTLVSSAFRDGVRAWDPITGDEKWSLPSEAAHGPIAVTPNGKQLITTFETDPGEYQAALYDTATQKHVKTLHGFVASDGLCVSPDGRYFWNGSQIWDTDAGKWIHSLNLAARVDSGAFSRDGKRVACGGHAVYLFDVVSGKELFDDTGHAGAVNAISVSADGKLVATAGQDGTARVWDGITGKLLHTFHEYFGRLASVSLSPDGKRLAAGDFDTLRVIDLANGRVLWRAEDHRELFQVAYSPDGSTIAVGGNNLRVHLYDAKTGQAIRNLDGSNSRTNGGLRSGWHFAWTPDSTGLVSPVCLQPLRNLQPIGGPGGEGDGKTRFVLWDVKTGERVRVIGPAAQWDHAPISIAPDGLHAAVGGDRVSLVELKTGKTKWMSEVSGWGPLAFAGDGKLYAGSACLDAKTGKKGSELKVDAKKLHAIAVPPKGKTVLTASPDDNTVIVWPR